MPIPKSVILDILEEAIETKKKKKIEEFVDIIYDGIQTGETYDEKIRYNEARIEKQHSDIMSMLDAIKEGFKNVDKRFEAVDKRFEAVDKRFEDIIHQMDKRFEGVDKRFEDMNKRFDMMFKFMSIGFSIITILIVIFKFVK